jgi:GTP-binding protein HflX
VALVGYTNAGKSTLLNAITSGRTYVDDRLFATLDTKTSSLHLPDGRDVLATDTVGFIRDLPHGLVASFRSTLDEAANADLLLLVVDASHAAVHEHIGVVLSTLKEIGAAEVPMLLVANKCDLARDTDAEALSAAAGVSQVIPVSALRKRGLKQLKDAVSHALPPPVERKRSRGWREW